MSHWRHCKNDIIPIGAWAWYSKKMADTFKKYEAMMAQKRQRKAEKSKSDKGKERLLPPKLTIQRLSAQVKGSSQKYARMGPLKRVDVLEDDLYKEASIDVIRRACVSGFNVPSMTCDILESERGPSIESLDEIKNLNSTIYVRFIQTLSDSDNDDQLLEHPAPRAKRPRKPTPAQSSPQKATALTSSSDESKNSLLFKPAVAKSLSVTAMLRLGRLIKPKKETMIQVPINFVNSNVYFLALFGF